MNDLMKQINAANNEFLIDEPEVVEEEEVEVVAPTDLLQSQRDIQRDYGQKQFPNGARALVMATIQDVLNGAGADSLAQAYERAKYDSEALKKRGEKIRAQIVENQYMRGHFLPAVEVVVNFTSPDELLNSEKGLKELDKYAMGVGSMSGFTAAYIREAYKDALGKAPSVSSPEIRDKIAKINGLLDTGQSALARGLAEKMKEKVAKGEAICSEEDYKFLIMVAKNWPKAYNKVILEEAPSALGSIGRPHLLSKFSALQL